MAQKTNFNQLLGQHGDKAAILLAALAMLAFGIMALTSGTPSLPIEKFESTVTDQKRKLDDKTAPKIAVKNYDDLAAERLEPNQNWPDSPIAAEATKPKVVVNLMVKAIGEVQPPAANLAVVSASKGSAILRWTTTKHPDCKSYKIKWWKPEEEEEPEWNDPEKSATIQQSMQDTIEFEIKGLTDNTTYMVAVRSWGPLTALDFKGATPSIEGPDNEGLRISVVSKGDTKTVPNPTNATVVRASLEGVRLQWDSPRSNFTDEPDAYVGEAEVRVLVWRWFGNDLSTKTLLNPIDGAHPGGWTLDDFDTLQWAMTDTNLRPETEIHYAVQYFHLEAFPDPANPGLSIDKRGKVIKEKSYAGEELEIELATRKRNGDFDVEQGTAGPILKGTEKRKVYASRMVLFDMNSVGGRVFLANKAIFKCTKVTNSNPSVPNFPGTSDGRLEVTKYFFVQDVESGQGVWRAFTAEFNVKVGDVVGAIEEPGKMNGEKIERNSPWYRKAVELDPRTGQPKPNQPVGKLDFSTPFKVKGIYIVQPATNIKINYIALCDGREWDAANTSEKNKLREFKIYLDKDLEKEAFLADAQTGLTAPATREEWLAAYRAYLDEVVLPAEAIVAQQNGGKYDRTRMKDKLDAVMYAVDGDQLMLRFSIKYGIRYYSPDMLKIGGQTANLNEIEYVRADAEKMIAEQWASLKGQLQDTGRTSVPDAVKSFVMETGNDEIAMADLYKAIEVAKGKPFAVAVWELVNEVLDARGREIKADLGNPNVDNVAVKLADLKGELERFYDLNRR